MSFWDYYDMNEAKKAAAARADKRSAESRLAYQRLMPVIRHQKRHYRGRYWHYRRKALIRKHHYHK